MVALRITQDIDEAVKFYTQKLCFVKREDTIMWMGMRWVSTSSKDQPETKLTLVLADNVEKEYLVGK